MDVSLRDERAPSERHFPTAQDMQDTFDGYIKQCHEKGKLPNKMGFCRYAGIAKETYRTYRRYGEDYIAVLENIENEMIDELIQAGNKNPKNSYPMYLMKSIYHMSDRPTANTQINVGVQNNIDYSKLKKADLDKMRDLFLKNREIEDSVVLPSVDSDKENKD
jgi:biotin synthase-like enzyme